MDAMNVLFAIALAPVMTAALLILSPVRLTALFRPYSFFAFNGLLIMAIVLLLERTGVQLSVVLQ